MPCSCLRHPPCDREGHGGASARRTSPGVRKSFCRKPATMARPVLLLHSTDLAGPRQIWRLWPNPCSSAAGFKVEHGDAMDWQSLVARRRQEGPERPGRLAAPSSPHGYAADITNPVSAAYFAANCDKGPLGLAVRRQDGGACATSSRKEADPGQAERHRRSGPGATPMEVRTHVHLGQWIQPSRHIGRTSSAACGPAPILVFWAAKKREPDRLKISSRVGSTSARRLIATIPVLMVVAIVVFLVLRLDPR